MHALLLLSHLTLAIAWSSDLDGFIASEMTRGSIPGLSAVAVNATHVLWEGAFGHSDPERRTAVTADTLFTHASVSKTVISFVLMRLYDEGLFGLDDDVNTHLGFVLRNPSHPTVPITPRQLLSHTSSINDDRYSAPAVYDRILVEGDWPGPIGDFLQQLLVEGGQYYKTSSWHAFPPGARMDYSNIGATTAAHLAECIAAAALRSGRSLGPGLSAPAAATLDFNALAMALFARSWPHAGPAAYHVANLTGLDIAIPSTLTAAGRPKDYCLWGYPDYPDGTFRASPKTYSYLLRTFINFGQAPEGSTAVLQRSTAAKMRYVAEGAGDAPGQGGLPQALIWYYDDSLGKELLGHNGGDSGIDTDAFFNPKTGVGFVVFTNGDDEAARGYENALQAIEKRIMATFDVNGGWPSPEEVQAGEEQSGAPVVSRRRRRRSSASTVPCGLPP